MRGVNGCNTNALYLALFVGALALVGVAALPFFTISSPDFAYVVKYNENNGYTIVTKEVTIPYQEDEYGIHDTDGIHYLFGTIVAQSAWFGGYTNQKYLITYACKPGENRMIIEMREISFPPEQSKPFDPYKCVKNATTGVCE